MARPGLPDDVFGTGELRRRVLAAWSDSPARFREDANAEEDLVRGGYRDRVVVELAQNAADAAARGGEPGRLRLALEGDLLVASNTGAPLDAAGVESLSTLRASSKRADESTVGRFGVGFAAVLTVCDEPSVASATGGVRWSASAARDEAGRVPALAGELARRGGAGPVLRLPWPDARPPEDGFTTTVVLPLRDAAAVALVRALLADVDDALLLALPTLAEVVVELDGVRRVVTGADRWQVVRRSGTAAPELLADRPLEERERPAWSLTWALPLAGQPVPGVLHAPTPTDEPLDLPVLLVASFPLDPTRRHVAPGPLTEHLVGAAASAYADLAADTTDPLALVPAPVPVGRLDGALRNAVVEALRGARLLTATDGSRLAPADATAVPGADRDLQALLAEALGPLVPDHSALERLGGRRVALGEAVEALAALDREPAWWRRLYATLDSGPVRDPEVLAVLPVPLADGRLVRGPRGALLPSAELAGEPDLAVPGLRLVHPDAAHPLLLRAGAVDAGPRTLLTAPETRALVEAAWDEPDPLAAMAVVLPLVAAAGPRPGELSWLADLPLPDADGEPSAADELVLPDSPMAVLSDGDTVGEVDAALVQRWGPAVLAAVGVLDGFTVREVTDVVLDDAAVEDELAGWATAVRRSLPDADLPPTAHAVRLVPELDAVADDRWPEALRLLGADPAVRSAVVTPVRVELGAGRTVEVPSYAAVVLRERVVLAGRRAPEWALRGSGLDGLYDVLDDELVAGIDPAVLVAAGVHVSLDGVLGRPGGADELLDRLAADDVSVPAATWRALWPALAGLSPDDVTPPDRVRVAPDRVTDATETVVVDRPEHLQVLGPGALVVPLALGQRVADLLDLDLSSEVVAEPDLTGGAPQDVPDALRALLPELPTTWWEHDDLVVDDRSVSWWRDAEGGVHASTYDGLARGLAAAAGRWSDRLLVAAALDSPEHADELLAESRLED